MIFLELAYRFFLVGLFSIGGGLATLPFLTDMGEATGWFGSMEISNMVAISESTPGPLGINMATYIGFQIGSQYGTAAGFLGSALASLSLVAPSVIIILIISKVLQKFKDSKYVGYAFYGLRAASVGLIASALLGVAKIAFLGTQAVTAENFLSLVDYKSIILSVIIFVVIKSFKKLHPIAVIVLAAIVGIIFKM